MDRRKVADDRWCFESLTTFEARSSRIKATFRHSDFSALQHGVECCASFFSTRPLAFNFVSHLIVEHEGSNAIRYDAESRRDIESREPDSRPVGWMLSARENDRHSPPIQDLAISAGVRRAWIDRRVWYNEARRLATAGARFRAERA